MKKSGSVGTLLFCIGGLYASFLTWSLLQERINTKPYGYNTFSGSPEYFKAPLIVNIIQALFAAIVGLIYSILSDKANPFGLFTEKDGNGNFSRSSIQYMKSFLLISLTSSLSSPLGYQSLKHVDYLAFLLAKSCKLIPVLLIHTVFYRTKFPFYKYAVALAVSGGVAIFTLAHPSSKESRSGGLNDGKTLIGMTQLIGSMILDGLTNSTQDQLFKGSLKSGRRLTGASLMCILNTLMFTWSLGYAVLFEYEGEITYTLKFVSRYPAALTNILAFALLGAMGQVFVFLILERFDSIILVTTTVTRKMISMILSVVLFGHSLTLVQWFGVCLVFAGIAVEAFVKSPQKVASQKIESNKKTQ